MIKFDSVLQIRLPAEMREALNAAAAADDRAPSAYARKVLTENLRKRGYLKAAQKRKSTKQG